jgi:hypothetical protein
MYSSLTGRFLTKDTWQGDYNRPLSLNRWIYGYGNPIRFIDPEGTDPIDDAMERLRANTEACYVAGDLNCIWRNYYTLATGGQLYGYTYAAAHLFQFLEKKGDITYLPLRSNSQRNSSAWVQNSLTIQHELPYQERIALSLIHSETRKSSTSGNILTPRSSVKVFDLQIEKDLYYSMNVFALWAEVEYEIRGYYEVLIRPTYNFWDAYDWHPDLSAGGGGPPGLASFKDDWAAALADAGLATEYEISGYWYGPNKVFIMPGNWLNSDFPLPPVNETLSPTGRW